LQNGQKFTKGFYARSEHLKITYSPESASSPLSNPPQQRKLHPSILLRASLS
jgi:hypothetical protein